MPARPPPFFDLEMGDGSGRGSGGVGLANNPLRQLLEEAQNAYATGYADGETAGYATGYADGETAGYATGYAQGFIDGGGGGGGGQWDGFILDTSSFARTMLNYGAFERTADGPYGATDGWVKGLDSPNDVQGYFKSNADVSMFPLTTEFTYEGWVHTGQHQGTMLWVDGDGLGPNLEVWFLRNGANYQFNLSNLTGGAAVFLQQTTPGAAGWHKWSITRAGGTYYLHWDGVMVDSVVEVEPDPLGAPSGPDAYFNADTFSGPLNVNLAAQAHIRISDVARYGAGNYTPESSAFTSDGNTLLLLNFDDRV